MDDRWSISPLAPRSLQDCNPLTKIADFGSRSPRNVSVWSHALLVGFFAVVVSTAFQVLLIVLGVKLYFVAFLPAVFLVGLVAGTPAGIVVALLTFPLVWWLFMPPSFEFNPLTAIDCDAIKMFFCLSGLLVYLSGLCRDARIILGEKELKEF